MALAATMAYVLMIFSILSFIANVKTIPVQIQKFKISSIPPEESYTDVYSSTTTDTAEAGNNSHLYVSTYEEMTHNPLDINGLTLTPSWITLPVETHVSYVSDTPPDEKSTYVNSWTTMLTPLDSIDIENGHHNNMSNNEEVIHNPPGVDGLTLIPSWITLPVETHLSYTSGAPPESTYVYPSTMVLTTIDSTDVENGPHRNMSSNEEVTINPPDIIITTLIPSRFTLLVETHEPHNTSGTPSKENNTAIDSSTTTKSSLDPIELGNNAPLVTSKNVEVPHNLSAVNDSNISLLFTLTVKSSHTNNTYGGPLTESSTLVNPSEIILETTTDSTDTDYFPFNMSNYKDVCGRQLIPMPRIIGGDKVSFGEWPWQISLRHKKKFIHKCGAVLFNENWAITTAHCVVNVPINDLHLILGKYDFSVKDEPYGFLNRTLQTVIIHPKYKTYAMEHDLALLRFNEPVKFQPNILPVCIPEDDSNFEGYSAQVTGWGALYYGGHSPTALQVVTVPVLNNSVCETMFRAAGYKKKIPDTFICAGWEDGGYDACKGDSGGPMVVQRPDNRWVVAGIISWGMRCGEPNSPGVYMRISKFKDWINQIILQP